MKPLIFPKERAQGLVEYALILLFVAIVLVFVLTLLGGGLTNMYQNIITQL